MTSTTGICKFLIEQYRNFVRMPYKSEATLAKRPRLWNQSSLNNRTDLRSSHLSLRLGFSGLWISLKFCR